MFRPVLMAVLFSLSSFALALDPASLFKNEILVSRNYEAMDKVALQTAPIRYLDSDPEQAGYASGGEIIVQGKTTDYVLDHRSADSNLSISAHYRKALSARGYELAYQCEGKGCGDTAGWRLLLGRAVAGNSEDQSYILGYKGKGGMAGEYVTIYVNEVDDQPRSMVSVVSAGTLNTIHSLPQRAGKVSLFYPLGQSDLGLKGLLAVDAIALSLNQHPDGRVVVEGFADGERNEDNDVLASNRAETVHSALLTRLNSSYASVTNNGGRVAQEGVRSQANRRVDLTVILPEKQVVQRAAGTSGADG